MARFEVCAQKWVDMSEGGHGVALINTGKYGHDVLDNVLRLSLLRSPKAPDPICDRGQHHFSYVLMPHFDQVQHSEVIQAAYAVNADPRILPLKPSKGESGELPPLVSVDNRSVVIESVKKAEDSKHLIVRMYECHNTRGAAHLSMAMPIKRAWVVDLNETILSECAGVSDGTVAFNYTPFEIVTLMVEI
jgi:alpha-mannosidase